MGFWSRLFRRKKAETDDERENRLAKYDAEFDRIKRVAREAVEILEQRKREGGPEWYMKSEL